MFFIDLSCITGVKTSAKKREKSAIVLSHNLVSNVLKEKIESHS